MVVFFKLTMIGDFCLALNGGFRPTLTVKTSILVDLFQIVEDAGNDQSTTKKERPCEANGRSFTRSFSMEWQFHKNL